MNQNNLDEASLGLDLSSDMEILEDASEQLDIDGELDLDALGDVDIFEDIEIDLDAEDEDVDVYFDPTESTDDVLGDEITDTVKRMSEYIGYVKAGLSIVDAPSKIDKESVYSMDYSEFSYLSEEAFNSLESIVHDIALNHDNDSVDVAELALNVNEILLDTTGESPGLNKSQFCNAVEAAIVQFRGAAKITPKSTESDLAPLIDRQMVMATSEILKLNTEIFLLIDEIVEIARAELLGNGYHNIGLDNWPAVDQFGPWLQDYLAQTKSKTVHAPNGLDVIDYATLLDALTSAFGVMVPRDENGNYGAPERGCIPLTLGISLDNLQNITLAEQLRQLMVRELKTKGELYQAATTMSKSLTSFERGCTIAPLASAMRGESTVCGEESMAAEFLIMILYLANFITVFARKQKTLVINGESGKFSYLSVLEKSLINYSLQCAENIAFVNPVFYCQLEVDRAGDTLLSYSDNGVLKTLRSPRGLLCDVVGDGGQTLCIPYACIHSGECTLLPPPSVVMPLQREKSHKIIKTVGHVHFEFRPTVAWLNNQNALDKATDNCGTVIEDSTSVKRSALLQVLDSYDNEFDTSEEPKVPAEVIVDGHRVLGFNSGEDSVEICYIALASEFEPDKVIANQGSLVFDGDEANGTCITFEKRRYTFGGKISKSTVNCEAPEEDNEQHTVDLKLPEGVDINFLLNTRSDTLNSYEVMKEYERLHDAVKALCSIASVDYDEELATARSTLADTLRPVASFNFGKAVAQRVAKIYIEMFENPDEEQMTKDANLANFREVYKDSFGSIPDVLANASTYTEELAEHIRSLKIDFFLEDVIADYDQRNIDVLCTQQSGQLKMSDAEYIWDSASYYDALRFLPGIGERIRLMEEKLVLFSVISQRGTSILDVTKRHPKLGQAKMQLTFINEESACQLSRYLEVETSDKEKRRKKKEKSMANVPLTRGRVNTDVVPEAAIVKYFVLKGDAKGLIQSLESGISYDTDRVCAYKEFFGLDPQVSIADNDPTVLYEALDSRTVASFFSAFHKDMIEFVEEGLYMELASQESGDCSIMAYDSFLKGHQLMALPAAEPDDDFFLEEEKERERNEFLKFMGSYILSYCPVTVATQGEIDGGRSRIDLFREDPSGFIYDRDLTRIFRSDLIDITAGSSGADDE